MKTLLCKLFGHKWTPKWHRHNHYYGITCDRCGVRPNKKVKKFQP